MFPLLCDYEPNIRCRNHFIQVAKFVGITFNILADSGHFLAKAIHKAACSTRFMAIFMLVAACGPVDKPATDGPPLKTYRHSMDQAPTTLDPVQGSNVYANFVIVNAYDTLYSYKYLARPYELKPNLAIDFPTISPTASSTPFA